MRKESRAMDSQWALEVMHKAPYMTVSFIDEDGKRKQYDKEGVEMKYGRMEQTPIKVISSENQV